MKNDSWGPGQNGGALSVADGDEQRFFFFFSFFFSSSAFIAGRSLDSFEWGLLNVFPFLLVFNVRVKMNNPSISANEPEM